tara:strand:- start:1158 stop:2417 length:1260 start_codon:yes stop_codon:yes gene_type:complete
MEWWQQLGFSSEEEAIARGESKEVFERTRKNNNNFEMTLDDETELIRNYIANRNNTADDGEEAEVIVSGDTTKYIIVQGAGGRYVAQADSSGTYTDANVQAEIDRLNAQRDSNLLAAKLNTGGDDTGGGTGVYIPRTSNISYEPVTPSGLTTKEEAKLRFPYLDERLIEVYVQGFVETGDRNLALLKMRSDPLMETVYPGIRKNDGTLRMTEQEYIVAKEFMELELRNYNLNPQVFGEDIVDAISGDVSPQEFSERLQAGYQNIVQNIPQVKEVYLREFNLDLNEESIFGMFISPRLSTAVLDNQIRQSQILAEAETALGTRALTVQVARGLQQQGLTQAQARRGFQGAAALLPGLSQGAERFGRGDITATEYVEATELGDQGVAERIRRIESQITSASSAQAGAARTRTGEVVGLEEI